MQHDFPDLAEDVPEQDLFLSSLPDMFDDYWGELEDMAVGNSEGLTAGSLSSGLGFLGHNDPQAPRLEMRRHRSLCIMRSFRSCRQITTDLRSVFWSRWKRP